MSGDNGGQANTIPSPSRYECVDNPCQDGYRPFEDEKGFMNCFPADKIDVCPEEFISLNNNTQELDCELIGLSSVVSESNKCRRGEQFINGLCREIFNIDG